MDPVIAFGVAAAAAQFSGQAKDIVTSMWAFYDAVRNAPKCSQELRDELARVSDLLDSLAETLDSSSSQPLFTNIKPVSGFEEILKELESRVSEGKAKGMGRLKWPFTEKENKRLLDRINSYKGTFDLALSIQSR